MTPTIGRRGLIGGMGGLALAAAAPAQPSSLPAQPSLLVAGAAGGATAGWADLIARPLGHAMTGAGPLEYRAVGGTDGVTGANQFVARTAPDGATALLVPGTALLAGLVGDPRVQFDVGTWAPLWGGSTTAIVATRAPIVPGQRVRIALRDAASPAVGALLALYLIGAEPIPVAATGVPPQQRTDVDAIYLRGANPSAGLARLGWRPVFALRGPHPHDADAPGLPDAAALFAAGADPAARAAFTAVSAACALEVALVAASVTPAATLAWWRRGCEQLDDDPEVRAAASARALVQEGPGVIAAQFAAVALDTQDVLALRTLLARRFGLRPG